MAALQGNPHMAAGKSNNGKSPRAGGGPVKNHVCLTPTKRTDQWAGVRSQTVPARSWYRHYRFHDGSPAVHLSGNADQTRNLLSTFYNINSAKLGNYLTFFESSCRPPALAPAPFAAQISRYPGPPPTVSLMTSRWRPIMG